MILWAKDLMSGLVAFPRAMRLSSTSVMFMIATSRTKSLSLFRFAAFPLVPTMHADDDLSLVETMSVFADIVRTARIFTADLPLAVTPVTLRERPRADPRQSSLLGAVWALGATSGLAGAGAESITLFETAGPRGLLALGRAGASVYPVYHVAADLCSWYRHRVVPSQISDPLAVACIAARAPEGAISVVLANALPRSNASAASSQPARARILGAAESKDQSGSR